MTIIDQIINSFETTPEDWMSDEYKVVNKRAGIVLWIANGPLFCRIKEAPHLGPTSLWDRWRLWYAFKRWSMKPIMLVDKSE